MAESKDEGSEALGRDLLRNISEYGETSLVLAALAAAGAPATLDALGQRLQAARDAQRAPNTGPGSSARATDTGH